MKKQLIASLLAASFCLSGAIALPQGAEAASYVSASVGQTLVVNKSVSFRKAASTSSTMIRYLKAGEKVTILGSPNQYWYQVRDQNGQSGYVSSKTEYVSLSSGSSGSGSGSSGSSGSSESGSTSSASVEKMISAGMKYLGTPYEYGSSRSNTSTFDCSDFVRQAFKDGLGITLPADSRGQGAYVKDKGNYTTDYTKLKRGDLVFYSAYKGSKASDYAGVNKATATITHVSIYLGDGKLLHTYSKASGGVITDTLDGHWQYRFLFGGSAL
ncbi:C40 family peptidase [Paenibacillus sp. y28]|uniref:C40 family peptidase n=1 Tax=Paenibacillus sp. y28 TaxID=3129110 RepID=UPI00301B673B